MAESIVIGCTTCASEKQQNVKTNPYYTSVHQSMHTYVNMQATQTAYVQFFL